MSALNDFRSLFYFEENDAGNFDRFLTKWDSLSLGLVPLDTYSFNEHEPLINIPATTPLHASSSGASTPLVTAGRGASTHAVTREITFYLRCIASSCMTQSIDYCEIRGNTSLYLNEATRIALIHRLLYTCHIMSTATSTPSTTHIEADVFVPAKSPQLRIAISFPRNDAMAAWPAFRQALLTSPYASYCIAVDFSGIEQGFPPRQLTAFAAALRQWNDEHPHLRLAFLYHVGESFRDKSLESAIRWCHESVRIKYTYTIYTCSSLRVHLRWALHDMSL
jgi:hypothetical protein